MKTTLNKIPRTDQPCSRIDFDHLPTPANLIKLNDYIKSGHDVLVRFFSQKGDWTSLEWTEFVPALTRVQLQNYCRKRPITNLGPLISLKGLQEFGIDGFVSKRLDLSVLKNFRSTLRQLSVGTPDIDADSLFDLLKQLRVIRSLSLVSADFEMLPRFTLDFLGLGCGQAIHPESFTALKKVTKLMLNGTRIHTLDAIFAHPKLREVVLIKTKLAKVGEFPPHSEIEFLYVDGHRKFSSLRALKAYNKLRVLVIRNCTFPPKELRLLNEIPNLANIYIEVFTKQKQKELQASIDSRIRLLDKPVMSLKEI